MEQHPVPAPSRRPVLVPVTAALGLAAAAVAAFASFFLLALGGVTADDGSGAWWALAFLGAAVAQAWGAVRLLRRRGWLPLALASLPGMLPLVALAALWLEYHQQPSLLEVLATIPVVTFVLTVTPPVRRWAAVRQAPTAAGADRGAGTPSGA